MQLLWLHSAYQFKVFLHVPPFCRNSTVNLSPQCSLRSFIAAAILDLQLPVSRHGVSVVFVEMLDKSSGCNCNVCKLRSWHFRTEPPRPSWNSGFPPTGGPKQSAAPLNLKVAPHFACKHLMRFCTTGAWNKNSNFQSCNHHRTLVPQVGWWADLRRNALGAS